MKEDIKHTKAKAAKDQTKSNEVERKREESEELDEALEDSFPASDPPSMTQPRTHAGSPQRKG